MSYVYLACPYTHKDRNVMEWRFLQANRAAAKLMKDGMKVFSPVSHSHPIASWVGIGNATDGEFWKDQDKPLLQHADKLIVLCLDDWHLSIGIRWEIEMATALGMSILYMYQLSEDSYNLLTKPYQIKEAA